MYECKVSLKDLFNLCPGTEKKAYWTEDMETLATSFNFIQEVLSNYSILNFSSIFI